MIAPKDFSLPGGELTPTMKLKRHTVMEMYEKKIQQVIVVIKREVDDSDGELAQISRSSFLQMYEHETQSSMWWPASTFATLKKIMNYHHSPFQLFNLDMKRKQFDSCQLMRFQKQSVVLIRLILEKNHIARNCLSTIKVFDDSFKNMV